MNDKDYEARLAEKDQIIAQLSQALSPFATVAQRFPVNPHKLREGRLKHATLWSASEFNPDNPAELLEWQITVQHIRDAAKAIEAMEGSKS